MRARRAAGWVIAFLLVLGGALALSQAAEQGDADSLVLRTNGSSLVEALMRGEGDEGLDARILEGAGLMRFDAAEAPEWFVEELFDPASFGWGIAMQDWGLVGFSCEEEGDEVRTAIACALEQRGWEGCEEDAKSARTLFKQEGRCRWLAISYAHGESATNIVLHIQRG